ncbi:glycosyltransferase [Methylobacterium aerolatum]|uniref:Uncharacterized protein n=1 Tax=Methylobacterium aerolatum TaxID=418708 RepID=A0ABU0I5Z5_9HYPH|nr:glycosyltransferase [Methylobacterium aerolatum]MDQ0450037.1 hypothetical protein [Methylobacterium aerolatum]
MKWYFCIDEIGANAEIGLWAKIAAQSAIRRNDLKPICLYDGDTDDVFASDLKKLGVEVVSKSSSIKRQIEEAHQKLRYPLHASGAFLRAEISEVEKTDEYVLYTDCDVFFRDQFVPWDSIRPSVFAAGPRQDLFDTDQFNSGVMVINVPRFEEQRQSFLNFASNNLGPFLPGVDEPIFNQFFRDSFDQLPIGLNWRPFFGYNRSAQIIHFHGPKMFHLREFVMKGPSIDWGPYASVLSALISSSLQNYYQFTLEVLKTVRPPGILLKQMEDFVDGYHSLQNSAVERFASASFRVSELNSYIDKRGGVIHDQLTSMMLRLKKIDLTDFKYVIDSDIARFPNIKLSLFARSGIGRIEKLFYIFKNGNVMDVDLSELDLGTCRFSHEDISPDTKSLLLTNNGYPIDIFFNETKARNREQIKSIVLHVSSVVDDVLTVTFSDVENEYFVCNSRNIEPVVF